MSIIKVEWSVSVCLGGLLHHRPASSLHRSRHFHAHLCVNWYVVGISSVSAWSSICQHFSVKSARGRSQAAIADILCPFRWDRRADSCPRHGPFSFRTTSPASSLGPCGSLTDSQVLENLPLDDPAPSLVSSSIIPVEYCRWVLPGQLSPLFTVLILAHRLTHPLVPVGDGRGRWDSQARSEVWPYSHYSGLAPCHYFSAFPFPPCSPTNPSVTRINSSAAYSSHLRRVLLQHLSCCTRSRLQRLVPGEN